MDVPFPCLITGGYGILNCVGFLVLDCRILQGCETLGKFGSQIGKQSTVVRHPYCLPRGKPIR